MRISFFRPPLRAAALVFAGSILVGSAFAQARQAAGSPPAPAKLRFLFLDESEGYYALRTGKNTFLRVSANPYEISSPYQPPALPPGAPPPEVYPAPIEIYKTSTDIDPASGQPRRVKIAVLNPPTKTPSALVIVSPRAASAPGAPAEFKVEIIDADPADFPGGSVRILNRGRVPMGAQFGTAHVIVPPGENRVVRPVTDARHRVFCKIAAQEPAGWRLLSDTIDVVRPETRVFGIFVYSPGGMKHTRTAEELAEFGPPPPGHFWLTFSDSP